ncbi:rhophilin-1 isoform X3 [Homo sapiens]|uniref:rhophilin-1 isoform X3 n=1 Tax=Homo sapiens TaxID=9606 RepID=UPI001FB0BC65|nr:rhophilin-1 isoform X3 [Homo sapiens]XP_054215678.1 rhophilin-1 isoform X3 [Homo sapiens]
MNRISRRKPRKTRVSSLRGRREGLRDVCAWRGCRVHRGEDPVRVHVGPMNPQLHAVGCDSLTQIQCGQLQSRRAQIHQQIDKELQMRTGAENLYRATSNNRVRETVALELSYVNSNLQLLKEELEELSGGVDPGRHGSEAVTVPMIPLGLKETKELDWSTPLKELISVHFGEDGASYEAEIRELEALRQAMRTPSRNESGLELLTAYYNQLCFLDARFLTPARSLGLFFHWYDSLTGVPAQQRALAFEKGSVLFNIGALHTQIGARQDRSCTEGARRAMEAFQRAAGAFSLLRENFSHAPSPDMSAASLCALEQLMMAQAQECVFEGLSPPASMAPQDCLAQLRLAQEAAQVAAEYRLVHRTMAQPPVHDYVPVSWTALVHVKAEYFRSLAHYHVAMALCDGSPATEGELPTHEQVFLQPPTSSKPRGPVLPQELEERRQLGKAHLKRAILGQEEALRLHALCRVLREVDLLRAVISQTLQRSLAKYAELDREDDFCEAAEAPDIQPKTHQKPEARMPRLSQGKGPDIFHRLGPLSVFSAKNRWRLVGPVHLTRGEGGFGLTLRGDSPVLIAAVIPGSQAAAAGLKEGDYIVSVNGQPCRWWRHAEVVTELKAAGEAGASLQVVSLLPSSRLPSLGDRRPVLLGPRGLLRSQREHGCKTPASTWASPRPLLNWSRKAQQGKTGGCPQPCAPVKPAPPSSLKHPGWP